MPYNGKEFPSYSDQGFFCPPPGPQPVKSVPQEELLAAGGGPCTLAHNTLDSWIALCDPHDLLLFRAFVISVAYSRPFAQMPGSLEHGKIHSKL